MVLSHTIEPVGVGFPNPSGEATSPLRLRTYLVTSDSILHLAPAGRHVYSVGVGHTPNNQSPTGRHGALCLNHGLDPFNRNTD